MSVSFYQAAWQQLSTEFAKQLPISAVHDIALRQPEQFRRLPNGVNYVDKGKPHLFDVLTPR